MTPSQPRFAPSLGRRARAASMPRWRKGPAGRTPRALILILAVLAASPAAGLQPEDGARAYPATSPPPGGLLKAANFLITPLKKGMLVRLPLVDNDPNRGVTVGVMPVWVFQTADESRIHYIHAPSASYNKFFGVTGTYRLYYYATPLSTTLFRFSWSQRDNRDVMFEFTDLDLFGKGLYSHFRTEWLRDGSRRFFGFGPDTKESDEANYAQNQLYYRARLGIPIASEGKWKIFLDQSIRFDKFSDGVVNTIPDLSSRFPGIGNKSFRMIASYGAAIGYDSRDSAVTTTRGSLLEAGVDLYPNALGTDDGDFQDYSVEGRFFHKLSPTSHWIFAGQLHFSQMLGHGIPFYAQSQLGGKFSLRAFGDRRFTDRGIAYANLEARCRLWDTVLRNVPFEISLDPFIGAGTVFADPGKFETRNVKGVAGFGLRAVARPQVVGSIDVGFGEEGTAVFLDINYSY